MAGTVDINAAGAAELADLPGIGPGLARRIVAHRNRVGRFQDVDALIDVSGIGAALVKRLSPRLVAGQRLAASGESVEVHLDRGTAVGDFTGHQVTISGQRNDVAEDAVVPFATSAPTSVEGVAVIRIPPRAAIVGDAELTVLAPDGEILTSSPRGGATLPETITIKTPPQAFGTTQPNAAPEAGRPVRVRGRVVDSDGKRSAGGLQVVVWGATVANPAPADFRALIATTTDGQGHFTGPYPVGAFTAAHASIATGDVPVTVPVHLDGQNFPESVILVADLPDAKQGATDCDCTGSPVVPRWPDVAELGRADGTFSEDATAGRCVDFTRPDRTLDEFSFAYVVRTTEPEIRGLELEEPAKVDVRRVVATIGAERVARRRAVPADVDERARDTAATAEPMRAAIDVSELEGSVDAKIMNTLARDPDGFSLTAVASAAYLTRHADLLRLLRAAAARPPGRRRLSCANPVDWDDDPTIYQACSIAHGHILRFKQEFVADGYSMGSLLYSLPLAPGQKKQIAIVDWERRETAERAELSVAEESMEAALQRDRDVNEIVSGTLSESTRGGSTSSSGSIAGGFGIGAILGPVGALLGVAGGHSSADSQAWQNSSRNTAASALNQLRDRTIQSASAVRSQRSSVVQSVTQGERIVATTESVANYNHCHAITVQYFEVLRHVLVRQRLSDVQECLLVPLLISWFTDDKALRWRNTLAAAVPRRFRGGFNALDRIAAEYAGSDLPAGRYADESLESVEGDLRLRFQLTRPRDKDDEFDPNTWNPLLRLFGFSPVDFYNEHLNEQRFKDRIFVEQLGPRIASAVVQLLRVHAVKLDDSQVDMRIDPTLVTRFRNDESLYVSLRMSAALAPLRRSDVKAVVISSRLELPGLPFVIDALPAGSRVIVDSGTLRYRTAHRSDALFRDAFVRNDLTGADDVRIETPLNRQELRNPRAEDIELARDLLDHLNENIEEYHARLWASMSEQRRFMLLDGFEAPNSGGRSVASVVDNELVGIVGNCLVLPVARGFHLDPTFNQDAKKPVDLLEHYEPNTPIAPTRVAIPTRGVYAEAVMGACNSCEEKDETRFWRWEESPIPDSPSTILPTSTDTRRAEPPDLTAKDFPSPIIAMQNAPAAPDPTGVGAALALLGQSDAFRDMAGLEGTQRNAAAALEQAFSTATTFGTKAADLALQGKMSKDIDKALKTIGAAKTQGLIDDKQAAQLAEKAISAMVGAGTTNPPEATSTEQVEDLTRTAGENAAAVSVSRPTGEKVDVDARQPGGPQDSTRRPIIVLGADTGSAETRAFHPARGDSSGVITVEASFRDGPAGATLRWSTPDASTLRIDAPAAARTPVRGLKPGRRELDVELLDAGGAPVASQKLFISVPQYVLITEDAVAFDKALTDIHIGGHKDDVVAHVKDVVTHLLSGANVRTYWQVGSLKDAVPAHVPPASLMTVTIRDDDPTGNAGATHRPGGVDRFDEKIDIFPGQYDNPSAAVDIDSETQALVTQLDASLVTDPSLVAIAVKVYGRLIGETTAHEIVHGLLWDQINFGHPVDEFHNIPAKPNDLMNPGTTRKFEQRTGMENTAQVSPVLPTHYVDHGIATIGGLELDNQTLMDRHFPVPPAKL